MTVLAERYELQDLLGSGGMAHVYAAVDQRLQRRVAVKLVRQDLVADGRARQRLLREARAAASFHHPNSVAVFDVGEEQRQPFIVMELVDGESLVERLRRDRRLDAAETARIGAGVLAALEAAHDRGLVHRDIKPGNVLLPQRGGVKLADFGIAKAVADTVGDLTAAGDVMGTPRYLSPEQAGGQQAGPASDLYSLGVVLYECLAGKPPFTADNPVAVALAHQRERVPPLRRAVRDAPAELIQIVETALAKDPAERFADAPAMRQALERVGGTTNLASADARAAANATTTALATDQGVGNAASAPTSAMPDDRPPTRGVAAPQRQATGTAPPPPPRRRRGLGVLAVILALAVVGFLVVLMVTLDPFGDDAPDDEPLDDEPLDDEPLDDEELPQDQPLPEDQPPPDEPEQEPDEDLPVEDPGPEDAPPDPPDADEQP